MHALLAKMDKRPTYPVGVANVPLPIYADDDVSDEEELTNDPNYEEDFVEKELNSYYEPGTASQPSFDYVSTIGDGESFQTSDVYSKHSFLRPSKSNLPIGEMREKITDTIMCNPVTIIQGPTGCGKTTQVPQMILDQQREKNLYCNIVVTQPRRIATINVAKRVCEERGWALGTVCGYQVGLERKSSPDQMITFMTLGVLLQKIIRAKSLREFTHVIIDEVHEHNQELDFLMILVRKYLFSNSPHAKVILMSATINAHDFAYYFRKKAGRDIITAPVVEIPETQLYKKQLHYLESFNRLCPNIPDQDITRPEINEDVWKMFSFLMHVLDKMDEKGIMDHLPQVHSGSVLVFLPGINEIEEAHNILVEKEKELIEHDDKTRSEGQARRLKWEIIPLHSSLPGDEQSLVFKPPKNGYRKIILSTNIAESSITVPDSVYVVDFCLTKVQTVDPMTKYMCLKLEWASHVNCEQRAGRVGRTCDGRVYRLVRQEFYDCHMDKVSTPEILRAPLEHVVLHTKRLGLDETPAQILALSMNKPQLKNIEDTICQLKEIGGLQVRSRGQRTTLDGDITFLGEMMGSLPISVNLSKMILLGQLFSCLEDAVIIAAGASIQNIFAVPFQRRYEAYKKLLIWADGSGSDLLALLNLYNVWQTMHRENNFSNPAREKEWCRRHLVNIKGLREWKLLVIELKERLARLKIEETVGPGKVRLSGADKSLVLKVVMAGAFYPNYFIKYPDPNHDDREIVKSVAGRDPFCTVFFTGLDPIHPGPVYIKQIKRMIKDPEEGEPNVQIGFDGSTKFYLDFKHSSRVPGIDGLKSQNVKSKIPRQVYQLLRKRQLKFNFNLQLYRSEKAWKFVEESGGIDKNTSMQPAISRPGTSTSGVDGYNPLPDMHTMSVFLVVSNLIDAGHLWAQIADESSNHLLREIDESLNSRPLEKEQDDLKIGKVYVCKYNDDGKFYRCKLLTMAGKVNSVAFIDYGNMQEVSADDLYSLPELACCYSAPLAIECILHKVKPAYRFNPLGVWDDFVNREFAKWTSGVQLRADIYSVVNDVVEVELYRHHNSTLSINQHMIEMGYADLCNPGFLSKQNHDQRQSCLFSRLNQHPSMRTTIGKVVSYNDFPEPVYPAMSFANETNLRGPFSPLEMKVIGCTQSGAAKQVSIDGNSVNAVLLDVEPEAQYSRMLVAGYVGQTMNGDRLMLRQTTMMPSFPGLPMLMAALFCPMVELKTTADNTTIAAMLCGLGYNEQTMRPLYSAHDLEIRLDTELTMSELQLINRLRYLTNNGIKIMQGLETRQTTQQELLHTQIKIKDYLINLVNFERSPIDFKNANPANMQWGMETGLGVLKPSLLDDGDDIWPLLNGVRTILMSSLQREISKNLEDLHCMARGEIPFEEIPCRLCEIDILFVSHVREHLCENTHMQRAQQFQADLQVSDDSSDEQE